MIRRCFLLLLLSATAAIGARAQACLQCMGQPQQEQKQGPAQGKRANGPHRGAWLRDHQNLSYEEQQKALENDPGFRLLPPQGQERLRQRLKHFNSMPPRQRERMLQRMERWDEFTPQQQERARNLISRFSTLPLERQQLLRRTARQLTSMEPAQREQMLNCPELKRRLSETEYSTLRDMLDLGIAPGSQGRGMHGEGRRQF